MNKEMTPRQRMEAVMVKREMPDKVPIHPWTWSALGKELLGVPSGEYAASFLSDGAVAARVVIASQKACGYDGITLMSYAGQEAEAIAKWSGLEINLKTPREDLPTVKAPYPVKGPEDVDKLEVPDVTKAPPLSGLLKAAKIVIEDSYVKENDIPVAIRLEDPGVHLMNLRGVTQFLRDYKSKEGQEIVDKMMKVSAETIIEFGKAGRDIGLFMQEWGGAGSMQDTTSLDNYKRFSFPYYYWINKELRRNGVVTWHHLCGQAITDLTFVPHLDADAYHVTEACDIAVAKYLIGLTPTPRYPRQVITGNIDAPRILLMGNPEEVETEVRRQISLAAEDGLYVMSTGCAMSIGTPVENVKAWVAARDRHGTFPLPYHMKVYSY